MQSIILYLLVALVLVLPSYAQSTPRVVATIKPLHSLVSGVMDGVEKPELVVTGTQSPHGFQLKPSDMTSLRRADVVFYIDDTFETFLPPALANLSEETLPVRIATQPGIVLLPVREGGAWETHPRHDKVEDSHDDIDASYHYDMHIWLSPANARYIIKLVAKTLAQKDPQHQDVYEHNASVMLERFRRVDEEVRAIVMPVSKQPFIVFHDAFQYFEHNYGLSGIGSIAVDPSMPSSVRRITEIRKVMVESGAVCVFREPQFNARLVKTVVEDMPVREGTIDPLGADLAAGEDLYFTLMLQLAKDVAGCLEERR